MPAPTMFIVYVADAPAAARFYGDLFDMTPVFENPGFFAFDLGGGVQLALWRSPAGDLATTPRTSELCLTLPGDPTVIDELFAAWKGRGVTVVSEPEDAVFGRTFVVADPDGNLIRVAPVD
ncbi:VOC family protein [Nocardia sp. NPDC024068]|uniref:VOC family protein n=1 Tax=Nocardia sp. NPDC024068 TaxID=3157197 RepID=UPI0033ED3148